MWAEMTSPPNSTRTPAVCTVRAAGPRAQFTWLAGDLTGGHGIANLGVGDAAVFRHGSGRRRVGDGHDALLGSDGFEGAGQDGGVGAGAEVLSDRGGEHELRGGSGLGWEAGLEQVERLLRLGARGCSTLVPVVLPPRAPLRTPMPMRATTQKAITARRRLTAWRPSR